MGRRAAQLSFGPAQGEGCTVLGQRPAYTMPCATPHLPCRPWLPVFPAAGGVSGGVRGGQRRGRHGGRARARSAGAADAGDGAQGGWVGAPAGWAARTPPSRRLGTRTAARVQRCTASTACSYAERCGWLRRTAARLASGRNALTRFGRGGCKLRPAPSPVCSPGCSLAPTT